MKKLCVLLILFFLYSCGGSDSSSSNSTPPPTPQSEGSYEHPVNLGTVNSTIIHSGSLSADGISFYKFLTSTSGSYFIATYNAQSRLYWSISLPGGTSLLLCEPDIDLETTCFTPSLSANTTYHLAVIEMDSVAGTFTLGIQ